VKLSPALKVAVVLAVVAAAILALVNWYPPARLAAMVLTGRSPVCPSSNAIRAADTLPEQIRVKDRILEASKLLRKEGGFHLWQTPDGEYWIPSGSDYVLPFNLAEQARQIYGTGARSVQKNDIVLDCGANVGVFVRDALKRGASKVVAIEPAPENIECLRRNFAREVAAGTVIVYPKGVWDKDDVLTLNVDPNNSAADSFLIKREGSKAVAEVPLTTIDKLTAELGLPRVDYIKMDIEGAEPNALIGARQTIVRFKPRLSLSAYHAPDHPERIPALVRAADSTYKMECGPCTEVEGRIRPDILYFFH
jgi:FkbM family methyltransferase